jgi:hypothetical protein
MTTRSLTTVTVVTALLWLAAADLVNAQSPRSYAPVVI